MVAKPAYKELEQTIKDLERKKIEYQDMEKTLNSYKQIISAVRDLMSILDKNYKYMAVNDAYLDFFPDKVRKDIIGHTPSDLIGERKFLSRIKPHLDRCLEGEVVNYQGVFEYPGKGKRVMDISYYPIFGEDGTVSEVVHISRDITELKQIEEALGRSEEKYRLLVDNAPVVIVVTRDGFLQFVNHQAIQITGYSEDELTSRPFVDFVHPDDRAMVMEYHIKRLNGEEIPELYFLRIIRKDGKTIWLGNSGVLLNWEEKPATLNFLNDITERKRVEEALHKSEKQKKTILDTSLDQIRYVDADLKIIWANKTVSSELGIPSGDVIGQFCYKLLRGRDAPCEGCPTVRTRETRRVERSDIIYYDRKGKKRKRHWDLYSAPLMDEENDISGFIQIARDITERKEAENRVRNLSQMLMKSQERERQMISYELHDRIAQNLSTLKIGCDTLLKYQEGKFYEIEKKLAEYSNIAEQTIIAVRDLAYDLRPPGIDEMGLVPAVEIYCEEFFEKSGLEIDFQSFGMQKLKLNDDTKIHLYRFIQEGLNNINNHADASRATIRLVGASPEIILRIEDNGKGFDVEERELALNNEKRMGLRSMKERANLLQGRMTIQSRLMKGTKIFIKFPLKEQKSEAEETHTNH